jgi:hypothetical protein
MQAKAKLINKAVRSKTPEASLRALGISEKLVQAALKPDDFGRLGVPSYVITNNGAELRRLQGRLKVLTERAETPAPAPLEAEGGVRVVEEENRVRIYFPGKPDEAVRATLKSHGFKWAPSAGAWQRMASPDAWYWARHALGMGH